jgi:transcriptional regulator with XRE-family HTH domain
MLIPEQIRAARAILKIKQSDLAKTCGISLPTIKRYEADNEALGSASQNKIAKIKSAFESQGIRFLDPKEENSISGVGLRYFPIDEKNREE